MPPVSHQTRAPEPSVDRVEELAGRILKADILLPKFQRSFVWRKDQIIALLDSIVNNYPVGSVLLWRSRQKLRSERNIADLDIADTPHDYPVNYLLDGQQRLSTICGALHWKGSDPNSRWNIAFDLRKRIFQHIDTLEELPANMLRLNLIPNPAGYFQHVASLDTLGTSDVAKMKENANELFTRFKDYKVATVTLHDMSIEAVAPIFERINSRGTALTMVDLMRAATWSEEFDLIDAIQNIIDDLSENDFGGIEKKTILRSVSAAAGGGFSESSIDDLRKHDAQALKEAVSKTREAYLKTVDFLSTELRIPSDKQLPYANQLVVLSEAFRLIRNPTLNQLSALKRWFWRTALTGYFGGWNTGNMAADQTAVHEFAAGKRDSFEPLFTNPGAMIWENREFRANSAHSKILILLLCFNGPTDLMTGTHIDVGGALFHGNNKEFHHFFPRDYLKNAQNEDHRSANLLANIVMLTSASNKRITNRAPSEYLRQVSAENGSNLNSMLTSNLISQKAYEAAIADNYKEFLAARSLTIAEHANRLTGWS